MGRPKGSNSRRRLPLKRSDRKPGRPPGRKSHRRIPFKKSEIERGIRAVAAMGLQVHSIELDPHTGKIHIATSPVDDDDATDDADVQSWNKAVKKNVKD
jgi:hypothetical protein